MRYVSVMQLNRGCEAEYEKRHDELWPELAEALKGAGIYNYFIYLHPETLQLFATFEASEDFDSDKLSQLPVMQKWWTYMADIMETQVDSDAPMAKQVNQVFQFNVK